MIYTVAKRHLIFAFFVLRFIFNYYTSTPKNKKVQN